MSNYDISGAFNTEILNLLAHHYYIQALAIHAYVGIVLVAYLEFAVGTFNFDIWHYIVRSYYLHAWTFSFFVGNITHTLIDERIEVFYHLGARGHLALGIDSYSCIGFCRTKYYCHCGNY